MTGRKIDYERVNGELHSMIDDLRSENAMLKARLKDRFSRSIMRNLFRHLLGAFFDDGNLRENTVAAVANDAFEGLLYSDEEGAKRVRMSIFGVERLTGDSIKAISRRTKHGHEKGQGVGGDI